MTGSALAAGFWYDTGWLKQPMDCFTLYGGLASAFTHGTCMKPSAKRFVHSPAAKEIPKGLAVPRHRRIEKDHVFDAVGNAIHDAGDDHAAVAVSGEHDVMEIFKEDEVDHVINVGLQGDVRAVEVHPFAKSGEGRAIHRMTILREELTRTFPFPNRRLWRRGQERRSAFPRPGRRRSGSTETNTRAGPAWPGEVMNDGEVVSWECLEISGRDQRSSGNMIWAVCQR